MKMQLMMKMKTKLTKTKIKIWQMQNKSTNHSKLHQILWSRLTQKVIQCSCIIDAIETKVNLGLEQYEEEKKGEIVEGGRSPGNQKKNTLRKSQLSTPLKKALSAQNSNSKAGSQSTSNSKKQQLRTQRHSMSEQQSDSSSKQ